MLLRAALLILVALFLPSPGFGADPKAPLHRIAFGSCAHQDRPQPIWKAVVAAKPELFLFIGDTVYADTEDMKVMRAQYAKLAALAGYKKLLKTCPVLATWDDHDYGVNDGGAEYPKKRQSQQVFLDFFGVPKDSPRRKQEGVYHSAVFGPPGKRVQVILLDTRYFRSPLKKGKRNEDGRAPYVPNKDRKSTILGAAQWKWLGEQLRVPAELRLLISSIQLVPEEHGFEKWMNFPRERDRLYKLIHDSKASGVIVLSGDRHFAELSVMDAGIGYPLFDLTSSGLNQGSRRWRKPEANGHRLAIMNQGNNFGMVVIDWERKDPLVRLQIRDEEGDITIQHKVPLSLLKADRPKDAGKEKDLAAEAMKHLDKEWTVTMQVAGTGKSRRLVFLNSLKEFRDKRNFTVVLQMKSLRGALKKAGITDPATHYRGKKVRVTGKVTLYNKRPQIVVTDLKQIRIVEK
jgi:alkaline phosphatase D